ncbi:MAG: PAS domain S-box protein [Desulfuromonadaceae bacterium]|nr:PAS domain S-box protein [Desulfuromonadaceae bacterium]
MSLSQRTILVIISTFIALLFILATTSDLIILSSFSSLEKADITSHTRNIANQIDDRMVHLSVAALEISETLQTDAALRNAKTLLTDHFMRARSIDMVAVYNKADRLIAVQRYDCDTDVLRAVSVEQQTALAELKSRIRFDEKASFQGVVDFNGSPLMVSFMRIKDNRGGSKGVVAAGWFIDRNELERVFRASSSVIKVYDARKPLAPDVAKAAAALAKDSGFYSGPLDSTSVAGYFLLKDIFGQPSFIVQATEKRTLYEHGKTTIAYIFAALFIAAAVFCCVMLLFVRGTILNRLKTLVTMVGHISEARNISARIPLPKQEDELKNLAGSINNMLNSLENAEIGRHENEERYRILFERAPDAIIVIGVEGGEAGRIVASNQAAADLHGYTIEEMCSLTISDLNTPEANKISGKITDDMLNGEWVSAELWHRKKDGTQFPIEIHAGLISIGGKKFLLGFDRDITLRKMTEETDHLYMEQIRQLNEKLSQKALDFSAANNELETFNYSVSHDMRGPLTRISGYCQLLLDEDNNLDPETREYVARIYESGRWLNDMIDALMQLAHLTREEINSDSVNLSVIAEEIMQELSLENHGKSIGFSIKPSVVAIGDPRLLRIVLANLLGNAWKYSAHKSGAMIEFGSDLTESGSPYYYVRDNGVGFDMKDSGRLFRVFTRLHDRSQFEGTGIGLATVQRIISKHGGRVWAEAEPDTGATFFFTLA